MWCAGSGRCVCAAAFGCVWLRCSRALFRELTCGCALCATRRRCGAQAKSTISTGCSSPSPRSCSTIRAGTLSRRDRSSSGTRLSAKRKTAYVAARRLQSLRAVASALPVHRSQRRARASGRGETGRDVAKREKKKKKKKKAKSRCVHVVR